MIQATFKVDPILQMFQRMVTLSNDLRPVLLKIKGESVSTNPLTVIGGVNAQFLTQGNFLGTQWKDLSDKPSRFGPGYATTKAQKYPGKTILRRTDKMFTAAVTSGAQGNVDILTYTSIVWGIQDEEIPYAKYHMTGTSKMPMRQFLGYSTDQVTAWKALVSQYIIETGAA